MYLAIKEILQNKLRYSLILTTIFLIALMVFFMTSLALGLVRNNRAAIDNWQATGVVLSDYANDKTVFTFSDKNKKLKIAKKTQKQAMFTKNRTSFTLATEAFSGT